MGGNKTIKYSVNFNRDYEYYLKYKDVFNFDGSLGTEDKVIYSAEGSTAKECFWKFDSTGKIIPTKEPDLLYQIFKCKGSINFNIKMWAEARGKGELGRLEFQGIIKEYELMPWMIQAVEKQKFEYYTK